MLVNIGLVSLLVGCIAILIVVALRAATQRKRFAAIVDVDTEILRLRARAAEDIARLKAQANDDVSALKRDGARQRQEVDEDLKRLKAQAADDAAALKHDAERQRLNALEAVEAARRATDEARQENDKEREQHKTLATQTTELLTNFDALQRELRSVEGSLDDISFGLYSPQYRFDTPEKFKAELEKVFDRQKAMVRAGRAASFAVSWTVNNSKHEGERMQKQYCKLILRAFNGECDAAIAKVAWNNASRMEERIRKSFDAINKLGQVMMVSISSQYRDLKLAELRLEHEFVEKKHEVAEEQRRIREQMRDEQRAIQEAERAQEEAEAEEARFKKALERAKLELGKARGEEHTRLSERIVELQAQLVDAQAKSVRAKSLAEMTRAGYVYVISNIGSFGENTFKIGMTRRLHPMERVQELSGASVPFPFDVHAMVYSDDAPALEAAFHQRFRDRSVNLVNARKEFFQVNVDELEAFAKERGLAMAFTKLAEAREYRESLAMRLAKGSGPTSLPTSGVDRAAIGSALAKFAKPKVATEHASK